MPRVVHFEILADDPERAVRFYHDIFGWEIAKWEGPQDYWLITTGPDGQPGINGGLMRREGPARGESPTAYVCTMDVDSVDGYVTKIQSSGGTVVAPKMAIPGIGWLAYCTDTEGNRFGIMQSDESAA